MKKNTEITQLTKPDQSTVQFEKFLKKNKVFTTKLNNALDIGCGIGANIQYFSKKFPNIIFSGWDYSISQIQTAKKINKTSEEKT